MIFYTKKRGSHTCVLLCAGTSSRPYMCFRSRLLVDLMPISGTNVQHFSENTRDLPSALEQAHEHLLRCILPTVNHWSWKCLHIPGGTLPWVRSGLQVRVTFFSLHSASYQLWPTSTLRRSSRKETNGKKISSSRTVNCKGASGKKNEMLELPKSYPFAPLQR